VNSHFGDSRVEIPKTLHQDSRNRDVRSPDRERSSVVGPALITSWNSTFWVSTVGESRLLSRKS
jgi:hypothetical protein